MADRREQKERRIRRGEQVFLFGESVSEVLASPAGIQPVSIGRLLSAHHSDQDPG